MAPRSRTKTPPRRLVSSTQAITPCRAWAPCTANCPEREAHMPTLMASGLLVSRLPCISDVHPATLACGAIRESPLRRCLPRLCHGLPCF